MFSFYFTEITINHILYLTGGSNLPAAGAVTSSGDKREVVTNPIGS